MYRTILLAYDGSRQGREALDQGAELASLCRARVHLLAVVTHEAGVALAEAATPSDLPEREYRRVQEMLEAGADRLRQAELSVETHLAAGNPAEVIGRVAREVDADLIVVGHREQSALARWWRGSVGASLLAHAPCSVLVAVSDTSAPAR
jgi:nucleotide-binding universal stress UspA family protein